MLKPVPGESGKFIDTETGETLTLFTWRPFEAMASFIAYGSHGIKLPEGDSFILNRWAILIHPWPEFIHPETTVELNIDGESIIKTPLLTVAEPLARSENQNILDRIKRIEQRLDMKPSHEPMKSLRAIVKPASSIGAHVRTLGDQEFIKPKYRYLRVSGIRRMPVAK